MDVTAKMPKLAPAAERGPAHLAELRGWLDEDDPFVVDVDTIVAARSRRVPRVLTPHGRVAAGMRWTTR